jgi:hypothetical protein
MASNRNKKIIRTMAGIKEISLSLLFHLLWNSWKSFRLINTYIIEAHHLELKNIIL